MTVRDSFDNLRERAAAELHAHARDICRETFSHLVASGLNPVERYGEARARHCEEDCRYHIDYLTQTLETGQSEIFIHYVKWISSVLVSFNVPEDDLRRQLQAIGAAVSTCVKDPELTAIIVEVLQSGIEQPSLPQDETISKASDGVQLSALAQAYLDAVLGYDREQAVMLLTAAADSGIPIETIYLDVLQPAQYEIGRLWQANKISVAQEHYCTSIAQIVLGQLYPHLLKGERKQRVAVAACVREEQHELGMRMVSDLFSKEGWRCIYLGPNTPTNAILAAIRHHQPHVLALSISLALHVPQLRELVRLARQENIPGMKIMVGGHPFNVAPGLCKHIGADLCGRNATEAVAFLNSEFSEAV
jgi:methanogenic corrinoid protein MtbC1